MKHRCNFTRLEPIEKLIPNPRNPNTHPEGQIELLARIIDFQGWRSPIVVSKSSGFIVRGHGRLLAAQRLKLKKVPIDVQTYDNEAQEWADMVADNSIAELAEMDRATLKDLIEALDTGELDLDLTGFDQASLDELMSEFFVPEPIGEEPLEAEMNECPKCGHKWK
jgi:ParB-like chromosome segregation protein Spo0J